MKIDIEAESQEEFDSKRNDIVKAIVGFKPIQPRRAVHRFQNEMSDYFDSRFQQCLKDIKKEVGDVLTRHNIENKRSRLK